MASCGKDNAVSVDYTMKITIDIAESTPSLDDVDVHIYRNKDLQYIGKLPWEIYCHQGDTILTRFTVDAYNFGALNSDCECTKVGYIHDCTETFIAGTNVIYYVGGNDENW